MRLLQVSLFLLIFLPKQTFAQSPSTNTSNINRIPYRLLLSNIRIADSAKDSIGVQLNMFNTGKQTLYFGKGKSIPEKLFLEFEEAFNRHPLLVYKEELKTALFNTELELHAGKMARNVNLKLEKTKPLADIEIKQQRKSRMFKTKKFKSKKQKKNSDKAGDTVSETITSEKNNPEQTPQAPPLVADTNESDTINAVIDTIVTNTPSTTQQQPSVIEQSIIDIFEGKKCTDIVIDSLTIIKRKSNKWLILEYTIRNQGNTPANIYGKTVQEEDNLALKAYLASSSTLSRGSLPVGGAFVPTELLKGHGELAPNQSLTGTMKLDIRKKTRFTSFIILAADPFNSVQECDKTNNDRSIYVD